MTNLSPSTQKKWIIPDPIILKKAFINHTKNYGSESISANIDLFYNKIKKLYENIDTLQKNTPIHLTINTRLLNRMSKGKNIFFGYLNEKTIYQVEIRNDGEILMNQIDRFLIKKQLVVNLMWDNALKQYSNSSNILKIIS